MRQGTPDITQMRWVICPFVVSSGFVLKQKSKKFPDFHDFAKSEPAKIKDTSVLFFNQNFQRPLHLTSH